MTQGEVTKKSIVRDLPVKLTEGEMATVAREIGRLNRERQSMEAQAKVASDQWKDRIRGLDARIADLATKADEGQEQRSTECVEEYDYRRGEVRVVRVDTGEQLEIRPMTATERQPSLPAVDTAKPPKGKKGKADAAANDAGGAPVDVDTPPAQQPEVTDPQAVLDAEKKP